MHPLLALLWVTACGSNGSTEADAGTGVGADASSVESEDASADASGSTSRANDASSGTEGAAEGADGHAAPPACPTSAPTPGQSCAQPQGCSYGSTCAYCAWTAGIPPFDCAARGCVWGVMQLSANDARCPSAPPVDGSPCGSSVYCQYCTADGLELAECSSINDTYTWSVGPSDATGATGEGGVDAAGPDS